MTILEKFVQMIKDEDPHTIEAFINHACPEDYGLIPMSVEHCSNCSCYECWSLEISENKEKESEDMPIDGKTDVNDILPPGEPVMEFGVVDYKQKYEYAATEILNLNAIIEEKNAGFHDILVKHDEEKNDLKRRLTGAQANLVSARDKIRSYEMVIRAVEAVTGKNIMEEF